MAKASVVARSHLVLTAILLGVPAVVAATPVAPVLIDVGSTGVDGVFNPTSDITINLATQGTYDPARWAVVFNYTSVNIPPGVDVFFQPHPSNAPVVWLVQGNVTVNGLIHLTGQDRTTLTYCLGGPGGFRGGIGQVQGVNESAAFGPGGAFLGVNNEGTGGSYASSGVTSSGTAAAGSLYGGPAIFPLIGGSGGSPDPDTTSGNQNGGGGGGGAILIAANGGVTINGIINAQGGAGHSSGSGSGGAIRLLGNTVRLALGCDVNAGARGTFGGGGIGGNGRIRIEGNGPGSVVIETNSTPQASISLVPGTPFPIVEPKVRVASLVANGQTYDLTGLDPIAFLEPAVSADVQVSAAAGPVTLNIEGTNIPVDAGGVGPTVVIRVTYYRGEAVEYTTPALMGTTALSAVSHVVNLQAGVSAIQLRVRLVP